MFSFKCKSTIVLIGFIWVGFALTANAASKGYKDVPKGHWAKDSVVKIVDEYQFMSGDPSGNFGGGRALSRYEFAKTISNMVEYYNREIETDRKDLENVVGVMELFQTEMKKMQDKVAQANEQVANQNKTISELNELVVSVADELNKPNTKTEEELSAIKERVALAEVSINELSDKGLLVDTLLKGAGNDAKHLGHAVANVAKKVKHIGREKADTDLPDEDIVTPGATIETAPAESAAPASTPAPEHTTTQEQTKEFIDSLDGYYAAPSGQVEYLTPIQGK